MSGIFSWLDRHRDWGVFLLRLFIGLRLIYGVQDNALSWHKMIEFKDFLQQFNFPFPLFCAVVSVYAQLLAGLMIVLGWGIKYAAIAMIINFLIALFMVHRNNSLEAMTAPLAILFAAVLFLFQGAGSISTHRNKVGHSSS